MYKKIGVVGGGYIGGVLVQDPRLVARFIGAAFAANILLQALGTSVTVAMGRRSALTVGFWTSNTRTARC